VINQLVYQQVQNMMKIYVRERQKIGEGVKQPKYRVVAVTGGQIQIEATHFRKVEIEQIAKDMQAQVVYMEPVPEDEKHKFGH
jgi:S-adenosylmethionine synthetase